MEYINVTLDILNKFSATKRMKELLAVAIFYKMRYSNSVVWAVTPGKLRKDLHIGKVKAERIYCDMKDCGMFSFDGSTVTISSFRDKAVKYTKKGKAYKGALVCKFEVKEYTLKELYNTINEKLFVFQVCAAEHNDCSMKGNCAKIGAKGEAITGEQFQKAIKMGKGSVYRIKKRLVEEGKISSSVAEVYSFDLRNKEEKDKVLQRTGKVKEDYRKGSMGYAVMPCRYAMTDRSETESFTHLIYGKQHTKVLQRNIEVDGFPDGFFA